MLRELVKFAQLTSGIAFTFVAPTIVVPTVAAGTVYDLATDWSDTSNPNGAWSYNDSNGPIATHQDSWGTHEPFWSGQDAWATTATGPGHIVAWLKSDRTLGMESNGGHYDLMAGDVNTHTWDTASSINPGTTNYSSVKWTSPAAGIYDFDGNMWQAYFDGFRSVQASVFVKGEQLTAQPFNEGVSYNRAAPFEFGMRGVDMAFGDVIELRFETTSQYGTHIGMNLTVTQLLPGDYNSDGIVDAADYTTWRDNFGALAGTLSNDVDGGTIGNAQYATWKTHFGSASGSAATAFQVPEPATAALLLPILLTTVYRRRHIALKGLNNVAQGKAE